MGRPTRSAIKTLTDDSTPVISKQYWSKKIFSGGQRGPVIYRHTLKIPSGEIVGTSVAEISINGWVATGWVIMFSGNQGSEIGGGMTEEISKNS